MICQPVSNQTSRQQNTWCHDDRLLIWAVTTNGPFALTSNAGGFMYWCTGPAWLPAADSAGKQPELQRRYQRGGNGWHKAGRCGKPQLLHSPRFENMKRTTAFDLVSWIRLRASEKKMALETRFPNYLPITPYPSFHSSPISDSGFDMKVVWRWSPGGGKSGHVGKLRPQKCRKFSSG